jgi:hypothetical protein
VLVGLGLEPTVPVDPSDFADARIRARWVEEKNMQVFSLRDASNPLREVDLFVEDVIAFDELWDRSETLELVHATVRVASIPDLIRMKEQAGRPQDLADIEALRAILERRGETDV